MLAQIHSNPGAQPPAAAVTPPPAAVTPPAGVAPPVAVTPPVAGAPAAGAPASPGAASGDARHANAHGKSEWKKPEGWRKDPDGEWRSDAARRAQDPNAYYGAAQSKTGAELLQALGDTVSDGHRSLGYKGAREAIYGTLDAGTKPNTIVDIYSGAELVRDPKGVKHPTVNAEHVWAQSWGATGIAKSDMHNLFASDANLNMHRWHLPFGEVANEIWRSKPTVHGDVDRVGTSTDGQLVAEPHAAARGAISRAQMYFYTRYGTGEQPKGFEPGHFGYQVPTLLKWHAEHPPTADEIQRNDQAASKQWNRNPFVDHPEFAAKIGFDKLVTPKRDPRPAEAQVSEWREFVRNPAGFYMARKRAKQAEQQAPPPGSPQSGTPPADS